MFVCASCIVLLFEDSSNPLNSYYYFTTIDGYIMPRYAELCENRSNFAQFGATQKLGKIRHNSAK